MIVLGLDDLMHFQAYIGLVLIGVAHKHGHVAASCFSVLSVDMGKLCSLCV